MARSETSTAHGTAGGLFARNATGLVRGIAPRSAYIINMIPGTPVQALGYGLFFAFALFPGGNFLLAGLLVIPLTLAFAYTFGLLTSLIPRSGGDYMLVGRVLSPPWALISSFCMTLSNVLSVAFFGVVVVTLGLSPGLIAIGLVGHIPSFVNAGNTLATNTFLKWVVGTCMVLAGALIMSWGWRWTARLQAWILGAIMGSLVIAGIVALFTSHAQFIHGFNQFAQPYTHSRFTYQGIIAKANALGVNTHPGFSFTNTLAMVGIFASFGIYSYFSTFVAGELRQARTIKTANMMALGGVTPVLLVLLFASIFLHTFGTQFMTAANATGTMPASIAVAPTYFVLIPAAVHSTFLAIILLIGYMLFWPLITYMAFLQPTRMIFAYAFDGIFPKWATKLSKSRSPYVALIFSVLLTEAFFIWALHSTSIFTVIVYATLIQLVSMALVGVAAIVVPWRRRELYQAGTTQRRFLGVPLVAVAGIGAVLGAVFVWILYFHYPQFGLTDKSGFATWLLATVLAGLVYYAGATIVRRRKGVDLSRVYAEIPPE